MNKIKLLLIGLSVTLVVVIGVVYLQVSQITVSNYPSLEYASDPVPDFNEFDRVQDKKQAFFTYLQPVIDSQNDYIATIRTLVLDFQATELAGDSLSSYEQDELDWLINEYRVKEIETRESMYAELLRKIDFIPAELVLAQSANESAWGTSRFARQGYNFFGLWCYDEGCGFVPKQRNDGAQHEVAKFDDLSQATYSYMRNINSHPAYKELRAIRLKLNNADQEVTGQKLAAGLSRYSERGEEYIKELRQMIRVNQDYMDPQEGL